MTRRSGPWSTSTVGATGWLAETSNSSAWLPLSTATRRMLVCGPAAWAKTQIVAKPHMAATAQSRALFRTPLICFVSSYFSSVSPASSGTEVLVPRQTLSHFG